MKKTVTKIVRCTSCYIFFKKWVACNSKICELCRVEKSKAPTPKPLSWEMSAYNIKNIVIAYHHMEKRIMTLHKIFEKRKKNEMKLAGVVVKNQPKCKRFKIIK